VSRPRLHLAAPAGSCRAFLRDAELSSAAHLIDLVRETIGDVVDVSGDPHLIDADEDEKKGGRHDDAARAADIQAALADDEVAAIVTIRGGSWMTRILPRIDFGVLEKRTLRVALFGFSEITTLVNIVGAYENGIGLYDNSPAFLWYGLRQYAAQKATPEELQGQAPRNWAKERLIPEFQSFFRDVVRVIAGEGTTRSMHARLVRGRVEGDFTASLVGGNLTVFSTLVGSQYSNLIDPRDRWVLLEDYNDTPGRLDRMLANLTLAGYWDHCAGLLLGDFHMELDFLRDTVLDMLDFHLPEERNLPILVTDDIGHIHPMSPLPLHTPLRFSRTNGEFAITWPAEATATRMLADKS